MIVVSGYRRTGTSAMMRALGIGGIPLIYTPEIEEANTQDGDYVVSPSGMWELGRGLYMRPDIMGPTAEKYGSFAVKVFFDGLPNLPVVDNHVWEVVFMERDADEIRASCEKAQASVKKVMEPAGSSEDRFDVYRDYNQDDIDEVLSIVSERSDMKVQRVEFADLIGNPVRVFNGLNLPIDIVAAAGSIDPEFYRIRRQSWQHQHGQCLT